jgi:hypothetical protein
MSLRARLHELLRIIDIEKLLAVERATVEKGGA